MHSLPAALQPGCSGVANSKSRCRTLGTSPKLPALVVTLRCMCTCQCQRSHAPRVKRIKAACMAVQPTEWEAHACLAVVQDRSDAVCQEYALGKCAQHQTGKACACAHLKSYAACEALLVVQDVINKQQRSLPDLLGRKQSCGLRARNRYHDMLGGQRTWSPTSASPERLAWCSSRMSLSRGRIRSPSSST